MQPTTDFFKQAQTALEAVVRPYRLKILSQQGRVDADFKSDDSAVTPIDRELERQLTEALHKVDSSIGIVGEEFGKQGNSKTFWLVDPIDGTESFIRGLPSVFNMATLIDGDEPVFAFVYCPITDDLYIAVKGKGSTKNGNLVHFSQRPLERVMMEVTAKHMASPEVAAILVAMEEKIYRFRRYDNFVTWSMVASMLIWCIRLAAASGITRLEPC